MIIIILLIIISVIALIICYWQFKKHSLVKLFESGNVLVSGLKGRGKDMLFCIVVNARKRDYISNVNYSNPNKKYKCFPLDLKVWELSGNTYTDMVDGTIKRYVYPYPDGIDYYISDAGIYFPAQYQAELVKKYKSAPMFQALSRHLGDCAVHCNVQVIPRVWDKIREQSDIYIRMHNCKVFLRKFVFLTAYTYTNVDSCTAAIVPPFFGLGKRSRELKLSFEIAHGQIKKYSFLCRIPYKYDSRRFKRLLENNLIDYEN